MNRQRMLLLFCLTALTLASCTDDKECPLCPGAGTTDPIPACDVYLSHARSNNLIHYNTAKPGVFDSIPIGPADSRLGSIGIANDGIHLINGADNGVTIYNIQTGEIVMTYPIRYCWVNVSRTGKYIVLVPTDPNTTTPHNYILDGETFEVISQTEYFGWNAVFSADDRTLYYTVYGSIRVIAHDIEGDSTRSFFDYYDNAGHSWAIKGIQITDDEKEMYLILGAYRINIYDIEHDTTTAVFSTWYNTRDMIEITPDGKQIIVSDPGDVIFEEYGSQDVIFFDTKKGVMSARVPVACIYPGEMDISADSRFTFVIGSFSAGFAVIDNLTHQYYDSFCLLENGVVSNYSFYGITCRRVLTN